MRGLGAIGGLLAAVLLAGCPATVSSVRVGSPAPEFKLAALEGGEVSTAQLRGHVAVVDFWASWCGPCREELPALEQLRKEYEPRGVSFVALNLDADPAAASQMAKQLGITMPVGLDRDKAVASAWQLPTMPTSYVLDATGTVRFVHEGFFGTADVEKFKRELDGLLGPAAAAP